jgi:hypothetical protein
MEDNTNNYQGYISRICFYDTLVGWHVGGGGKILHTTTGGDPIMSIKNQNELIADDFILNQNYPNPFNNQTKIKFDLPKYSEIRIIVFDLLGRKKDIITDGIYQAGKYEVNYSPKDLSSGIYFYRMEVNGEITKTRKLILNK